MAVLANMDLELLEIDVKTTFLNDELTETIYMEQLEGFIKRKI